MWKKEKPIIGVPVATVLISLFVMDHIKKHLLHQLPIQQRRVEPFISAGANILKLLLSVMDHTIISNSKHNLNLATKTDSYGYPF